MKTLSNINEIQIEVVFSKHYLKNLLIAKNNKYEKYGEYSNDEFLYGLKCIDVESVKKYFIRLIPHNSKYIHIEKIKNIVYIKHMEDDKIDLDMEAIENFICDSDNITCYTKDNTLNIYAKYEKILNDGTI